MSTVESGARRGQAASALAVLEEKLEGWSGVSLDQLGKRRDVAALIRERARALGAPSIDAYQRALVGPRDPEVLGLVDIAFAGSGWFFRDPARLELVEGLLRRSPRRALRAWVAGCGTGEEAWALAMLARSTGRNMEVLGTELTEGPLERARAARYASWVLREFPSSVRGSLAVTADNRLQVVGAVRDSVRFEQRSLLEPPPVPSSGAWDLVICRGPLSVFRPARALRTLQRFGEVVEPQGAIVLGERDLPGRAIVGFEAQSARGLTVLRRRIHTAERNVLVVPRRTRPSLARVLRAGSEHLRDGAPEKALALFEEAVFRSPLIAEAHLLAGISFHRLGDPVASIQSLRRALFLAPDLWPAAYHLALSHEELGESKEAHRAWSAVLEAGSRNRVKGPAPSGDLLAELESWRSHVLELARKRTRKGGRRPSSTAGLTATL